LKHVAQQPKEPAIVNPKQSAMSASMNQVVPDHPVAISDSAV
jgi:hypothetical protein